MVPNGNTSLHANSGTYGYQPYSNIKSKTFSWKFPGFDVAVIPVKARRSHNIAKSGPQDLDMIRTFYLRTCGSGSYLIKKRSQHEYGTLSQSSYQISHHRDWEKILSRRLAGASSSYQERLKVTEEKAKPGCTYEESSSTALRVRFSTALLRVR